MTFYSHLVGGFNPSEKYISQIESFPQVGMKIKNSWNHRLAIHLFFNCSSIKLLTLPGKNSPRLPLGHAPPTCCFPLPPRRRGAIGGVPRWTEAGETYAKTSQTDSDS